MSQNNAVSHWLPCPVVFVSTAFGEKRDIMTATAMFVSEHEPLLAISVSKDHLTALLLEQAGGFTLVIASTGQQELVWQLGSVRGAEEDKFQRFAIKTLPPQPGEPLIPADAAAWLKCKVVNRQEINGYYLVIARVVAQKDLGNPPLLWQKQGLFTLQSL